MNRPTLIVSLMIIAGTLILMGGSYAYFTAMATSNVQGAESGILELTYQTNKNITLENVFPTEEIETGVHQFAIENTGTLESRYYLYLDNIVLQKDGTDTQSGNLKWKLYRSDESYSKQSKIADGDLITGNHTIELATGITIQPSEKHYYILKVWLQETGSLQNEDQGLSFGAQVVATTEKKAINKTLVAAIKQQAVLDNIQSTYVTSSTGIDFSQISSDSNGKGLYILHETENDSYPIMYYRGAVENNHVKFANYCWLIVRTTETGGVKLVYNGETDSNGQCSATGDRTILRGSAFNSEDGDNAYVGYMYGEVDSESYEATHANVHDSTIKSTIDEWYGDNMVDYTDRLEDTVWCNDRSLSPDSASAGMGKLNTGYGADARLYVYHTPSLECVNENDRFTVSSENGNGALTYPVALLTADEIVYAGGVNGVDNNNFYLNNGNYWWSLSPYSFNGTNAAVFDLFSTGSLYNYYVFNTLGVRPAISLKYGVMIQSGGDGSKENPYVIV